MIMLDTVDFPIVFLGAIRAGVVPVPLNTLLTSDQYAYVLADCRARVLFISERCCRWSRTCSAGCRISSMSSSPATMRTATRDCPTRLAGESDCFTTAATHADEPAFWLYSSGSTGMPKGVRHLHANLAATAETYAQQVLGIREDDVGSVGGKTVFRLWPRQRADVSDVGRRHHRAQFRAADAGGDVRADAANTIRASSSACRRCSRRCSTTRP